MEIYKRTHKYRKKGVQKYQKTRSTKKNKSRNIKKRNSKKRNSKKRNSKSRFRQSRFRQSRVKKGGNYDQECLLLVPSEHYKGEEGQQICTTIPYERDESQYDNINNKTNFINQCNQYYYIDNDRELKCHRDRSSDTCTNISHQAQLGRRIDLGRGSECPKNNVELNKRREKRIKELKLAEETTQQFVKDASAAREETKRLAADVAEKEKEDRVAAKAVRVAVQKERALHPPPELPPPSQNQLPPSPPPPPPRALYKDLSIPSGENV